MEFSFQTVYKHYLVTENKERNSDLDKKLDNTYIEYAIYTLFHIDILSFIKTKSILAKEFHIQPSEIDKMPVWEYELFLKEINAAIKEENEKQQQELNKSGYKDIKKMHNPKYSQQLANKSMPKMPSMPKI